MNKIKLELIGSIIALILSCVMLGYEYKRMMVERELEQIKTIEVIKYIPTPKMINKPNQ